MAWRTLICSICFVILWSPFTASAQSGKHRSKKASASSPPAAQAAASTGSGEFTIRTTTELVQLDVSVKDTAGGFVSGLTKESFNVFEDGKPQEITQFSNSDIPVTVGLLIDESGSMRPKRPEVITAALTFAGASNPKDEAFVLNFNEKVRRGLPDTMLFTDNIRQLRTALFRGVPEGRTALYDAIMTGLDQLEMGRQSKKTLIVISDGGDNISQATMKDVVQRAIQSEATIYTIGIFDKEDPDRNPDILKRLANISGGEVYFPEQLEGIVPVCRKIAADIRARYTIAYVPQAETGHKIRRIKVLATAAGHGKLVARTRTEYMMTDRPSTADNGNK